MVRKESGKRGGCRAPRGGPRPAAERGLCKGPSSVVLPPSLGSSVPTAAVPRGGVRSVIQDFPCSSQKALSLGPNSDAKARGRGVIPSPSAERLLTVGQG